MYHPLPYAVIWIVEIMDLHWEQNCNENILSHLMHIAMLCPMNTQNKSGKGLNKYDPSKYNMIQQLTFLLVAWPFIVWEVYQNAVMFAARNVSVNGATEFNIEIKNLKFSQHFPLSVAAHWLAKAVTMAMP